MENTEKTETIEIAETIAGSATTTKKTTVQLPEAFLARMKGLLGAEMKAFEASYENERAQGLRFNTRKGSLEEDQMRYREKFGLKPVLWCREGFITRQSQDREDQLSMKQEHTTFRSRVRWR